MKNEIEIGIDSFAAKSFDIDSTPHENRRVLQDLLERIEYADNVGLDVFGIGEHYRKEFVDSAPTMILSAAASRTQNIRLTSAVTVLGTSDPVRVFQNFSTLDLISNGRAEIVVGRGSSVDSFPLFGFDLKDYDEVFSEKLELLLKIRENEVVNWQGDYRPSLSNQPIYPRPLQDKLPIWLGVGGTPNSFIRAGNLGLPLVVAVIGGETHRFKPLIDLYRQAGKEAGYSPDQLKVSLHSLGYIADSREEAIAEYFPGYAETFTRFGKQRGMPPVTRKHFDDQNGPKGALVVGGPDDVAEKILRHSEALGGITRFTFQMDSANLPNQKLLHAIELIGDKVKSTVNK